MENNKAPLWLWPNILSLDAPLVAVAWVWMFQKAFFVSYIEAGAVWVLFAAVWSVYVLDRIIDVWSGKKSKDDSHRHRFSWKYRWPLLVAVCVVSGFAVHYSLYYLPAAIMSAGIVAVVLSLLYFISIPFQSQVIPYAKNLGAGVIFAFGVAIPTGLYNQTIEMKIINDVVYPLSDDRGLFQGLLDSGHNIVMMVTQHLAMLLVSWETLAFAALCALNITAIDLWDKARKSDDPEVKQTNETILTIGIFLLVLMCFILVMFVTDNYNTPYFYSIMAACGFLHLLNRNRSRFTLDGQRVLADVALLVPIPFYYIFTQHISNT